MSRVIALGIDGLDPSLFQKFYKQGKLPNLSELADKGSFSPLATVTPPQSPVVWSSIATGSNPGVHGIFDFLHRDPKTYLPILSIFKPKVNGLGLNNSLFDQVRKGTPFWQVTSEAKIETSVLRWPVTFPPEKVNGVFFSGMGVPDLHTRLGRYTLISEKDISWNDKKGELVVLKKKRDFFEATLEGPVKTRLTIQLRVEDDVAKLTINNFDYQVKKDQWTDWIPVKFEGFLRKFSGIVKLLPISISPLKIYMTSVHLDPREPEMPITYPENYSQKLTQQMNGVFSTLGMPYETNGLIDEVFSYDNFLSYVEQIHDEQEKLLWKSFDETSKNGVFAYVFTTLDVLQHMFWFTSDKNLSQPPRLKQDKYDWVLPYFYQKIDDLVGKFLKTISKDDLILIFSDHGFASYKKSFHINHWLVKAGLMKLKDNSSYPRSFFENVDWSKTAAYSLGFSSIYLNKAGRESQGILNTKSEIKQVIKQIQEELPRVKDPENGQLIVHQVYVGDEIYHGSAIETSPDLIIGTRDGYRVSWQTALGGGEASLVEDNQKKWCGDHIIDASYVPGAIFSNIKFNKNTPHIYDIAPSIYAHLGLKEPKEVDGKSLI